MCFSKSYTSFLQHKVHNQEPIRCNRKGILNIEEGWDVALSIKCLPHKHENLGLVAPNSLSQGWLWETVTPMLEEGEEKQDDPRDLHASRAS